MTKLVLLFILIQIILTGCVYPRHYVKVKNISTPKKKEIKRAMKYSTYY